MRHISQTDGNTPLAGHEIRTKIVGYNHLKGQAIRNTKNDGGFVRS